MIKEIIKPQTGLGLTAVLICDNCGKEFRRRLSHVTRYKIKRNYCCRQCFFTGMKEKNHPNWKGGRYVGKDGYIYIYLPDHPLATKDGYVCEHRLVVEKDIGRYLTSDEVVHHYNNIKDDNRKENLMLFKTLSAHQAYHNKQRRLVKNENRV